MKNKSLLVLLNLLLFTSLQAQIIYVNIIPESIETLARNTDFIQTDPQNLSNALTSPGVTASREAFDAPEPGPAGQFGIPAETVFTPRNIYFNLPLRYRWKGVTAEIKLPVILKREIRYGDYSKSAPGLGDAVFRTSYRLRKGDWINESMVHVKAPTGDQDKTVDGIIIPMGTGSTDLIFQNIFMMRKQQYSLYNSVSFRLNTPRESIVQINHQDALRGTETITYNITNASLFIINSSFSYNVAKYAAVLGGVSLSVNGKGNIDRSHTYSGIKEDFFQNGISAEQDYIFLDLYPAVAFTAFRTDLMLTASVPVLTVRNESNTEEDRKPGIMFRLSRELF